MDGAMKMEDRALAHVGRDRTRQPAHNSIDDAGTMLDFSPGSVPAPQVLQQHDAWTPSPGTALSAPSQIITDICNPSSGVRNVHKACKHNGDEDQGFDGDDGGYGYRPGVKTRAREALPRSPSTAESDLSAAAPQRPHAAVERRYRRTVNTKLQQLYTSIPASGKFSPDRMESGEDMAAGDGDQAAKPAVLDKAIQYVQHLIETYQKYDSDIEDIKSRLRGLIDEGYLLDLSSPSSHAAPLSGYLGHTQQSSM